MNFKKIQHIIQKSLLALIIINLLFGIIMSFTMTWSNTPAAIWADLVLYFIGYLLGLFLIYRKNFLGAIIICLFAYQAMMLAKQFNLTLSMWLLKISPSMFFSLTLDILLIIFSTLYFIIGITLKWEK